MQKTEVVDSKLTTLKITSLTMTEQVSNDLNHYLNNSGQRQKKLNFISKKIGVHSKTLNRISLLENKPSYITVFKIYRFLFNENNDAKVLELCPDVVREYLKKANPQTIEKSITYSTDVENEISGNPIALELVVLCSTGELSSTEIKERFGTFGIDVANKLISKRILSQPRLGFYKIGQLQMNMSPKTVIDMGLQITASYAKPENGFEKGQNFNGFYAEGLTLEAYNEWLKIDEDAFQKKVQIAQKSNSLGKIKVFTFNSTDTLEKKDLK